MSELIERILGEYLQFLWNTFQYDMDVFSKGWIYFWLLIPAIFYFIFFIIKWMVVTAPFWVPIKIIFSGIRSVFPVTFAKTIKKQVKEKK